MCEIIDINENNFLIYAARFYTNPIIDSDEFNEDVQRFKYLKRLFSHYEKTGELKERLIINHVIILFNVFGKRAADMLFFKLPQYHSLLVPFLVLLHRLPKKVILGNTIVYTADIPMDLNIVNKLRKIK